MLLQIMPSYIPTSVVSISRCVARVRASLQKYNNRLIIRAADTPPLPVVQAAIRLLSVARSFTYPSSP